MDRPPSHFAGPTAASATPGENLARFSSHTGAPVRPLDRDEPCPILFRDIGPVAMARFLRGTLDRLGGPFAPVVWMRTAGYREPYVDYGRIGRLIFLHPETASPWHSGVAETYIAPRSIPVNRSAIGFLPSEVACAAAAGALSSARSVVDLQDCLGAAAYREACLETLSRLDALNSEHDEAEQHAGPLRKAYQSRRQAEREAARAAMEKAGLTESDLCTAWHHLPDERRAFIGEAMHGIAESTLIRKCPAATPLE